MLTYTFILYIGLVLLALVLMVRTVKIVPQKWAYIIENMGRYDRTLGPGFHLINPLTERVARRIPLMEQVIDVPPQACITKDNIQMMVDGVLYLQVLDPVKAAYEVTNYIAACVQLAQTTMRSVIGDLEMDETFKEREKINRGIISAVDKASDPWGVKVTRYEVREIDLPDSIKEAMERQFTAERDRRAVILESEGKKTAAINVAEGEKQAKISRSEGEMRAMENLAKGQAAQILEIAKAQAQGIREVAKAIEEAGGEKAVAMRLAQQYIEAFSKVAKETNAVVVPTDLTDIASIVGVGSTVLEKFSKKKTA